MDLKQFCGVYILHMLDHATRYSAAAIISSKQKEVVIDKILLDSKINNLTLDSDIWNT